MSNDVTVALLKSRALDYADMTNSSFPNTTRLLEYLNDGAAELHEILVNTFSDYMRKTQSISVLSGTETYALPTDYYKTLKMFYVTGGRRYKVQKFNLDEIDGYKSTPDTAGTLEHWYVPMFDPFTGDSDKVSDKISFLPIGWEDFIALHAAIRLLIREESDPSALMQEKEMKRQRMINFAESRDVGEPKVISDNYNRWGGSLSYFKSDNTTYRYRIMGDYVHIIETDEKGL